MLVWICIAYGNARSCQVQGGEDEKKILNRLSLQHACTSRRNIHNGFII